MCLLQEFKLKAHLARHYATAHGLAIRSGSPRPIMKTRTAFYLCTTPLTRISRRLCRHLIQPRHAARAPFWPINIPSVKQECKDTNINILGTIRWEFVCSSPEKKGGCLSNSSSLCFNRNVMPWTWLLLLIVLFIYTEEYLTSFDWNVTVPIVWVES